jgi:hypothetical protein
VTVTYETIRAWGANFGPSYAAALDRRRAQTSNRRHLDEVHRKIKGKAGSRQVWRFAQLVYRAREATRQRISLCVVERGEPGRREAMPCFFAVLRDLVHLDRPLPSQRSDPRGRNDLVATADADDGRLRLQALALGFSCVDAYLEFVRARARPNTWLAITYDVLVFFAFVLKDPAHVTADVFAFLQMQRTAR